MAYRSKKRGFSRRNYTKKRRSSGGFRSKRRYGGGGGGKTIRIVVEQAAPTGSVIPAANAAVQMASKRSMF